MSIKHPQHILAILSSQFPIPDNQDRALLKGAIEGGDIFIGQREGLENNAHFRQILPYTIIRCKDKYCLYQRKKGIGESRLLGKLSCGFGGHVDLEDAVLVENTSIIDLKATIATATAREISEELDIEASNITSLTQLPERIVSNATDVDKHHIALLLVLDIESPAIASTEPELEILGFYTKEEIAAMDNLESWTQILMNDLL